MRPFVLNSFNVYIPITTSVDLGVRARERIRDQVLHQGLRGRIPGMNPSTLFHDAKVDYWGCRDGILPEFVRQHGVERFRYYCEDKFPVDCWFDVRLFRLPLKFPPFRPYHLTAARDFLVDLLRVHITREVVIIANTPKAIRTRAYQGTGPYEEPKRWTLEFSGPLYTASHLFKQVPSSDNPDTQPVLTEKKKEQVK